MGVGILGAVSTFCTAANTGPTLLLDYQPSETFENPVDAFMYFVPLNSLTGVRTQVESGTTFTAGVINWQHKAGRKNTFTLSCDFEISGQGCYKIIYDAVEMIEMIHTKYPDDKTLTNLLDWIQFEGPCQGSIEATGRGQGQDARIEEVTVSFTRDGSRSPVVIAIYDVPCINRCFDYANRRNTTIARVTTLTFKRTENTPRMSVEIASLKKADQSEGWMSSLTAMLANLVLTPLPISRVGNDTMLDFGLALYQKRPDFTFPVAETLRSSLANTAQLSTF